MIIGMLLGALQQFSGINALITYSTTIFMGDTDNGATYPTPEEFDEARNLTTFLGILNFISPIFAGALMYRVGRKDLLVTGLFMLIGCWLAVVIFLTGDIPKIAILVYIVAFGISLGPIVWIYVAEILPDLGVSLAALANWSCAVLVIQTFPLLQEWTNARVSFGVFLVSCIAGLVFVTVWVKETKDKTNSQIIEMYGVQERVRLEDEEDTDKNF